KQDCQPAKTWHDLAQKFEALAGNVSSLHRQTGDVAARMRQACHKTGTKGINSDCKDNGNRGRRSFYCGYSPSDGPNHVDLSPDQLGSNLCNAFSAPVRPSRFDYDGAALHPAEFSEALPESAKPFAFSGFSSTEV